MASDDLNPRKRRHDQNPNPNIGSMNMNADDDIPQLTSKPQIPRELVSRPSRGSDVNLGIGCSSNLNPRSLAGESSRNSRHIHLARGTARSMNTNADTYYMSSYPQVPREPVNLGIGCSRNLNPQSANRSLPVPGESSRNPRPCPMQMQQQPYAYHPPQQIRVDGMRCFSCNRYLTSAPQGLSYHPRSLPTPLVLMSCGHLFHQDCLRAHLRLHAIAPTPRSGNPPCPLCWAVAPSPGPR